MKVLIIDDDSLARKILVKALEKMGHVTIQSGNGKHAWETIYENDDIGLVVTDLMMPDMDGRELLQILRGNQAFASLPVLMVSGVVGEEALQGVMHLGHCRFCPKPLDLESLKKKVNELLADSEKR